MNLSSIAKKAKPKAKKIHMENSVSFIPPLLRFNMKGMIVLASEHEANCKVETVVIIEFSL